LVVGSVLALVGGFALTGSSGCAGVKGGTAGNGGGGSGGHGGTGGITNPPIPHLTGLTVTPDTTTVTLTVDATGKLTASATLVATGTFDDGTPPTDVSGKVNWNVGFSSITFIAGNATITAPGTYLVTAASGSIVSNQVTIIASFTGAVPEPGFDPGQMSVLDATPSGSSTIAYPLEGALFPSNLGPIMVQINKGSASSATLARLNFKADQLDFSYYAKCQTTDPATTRPLPGAGCYVVLPLSITQLMIPSSENGDIKLTARVGGSGAPAESAPIDVAWSNVPLTGGLYYWSVVDPTVNAGWTSLDIPAQTKGTGVYRYDLTQTTAAPQLIWTDDGVGPNWLNSSPQAVVGSQAGSHCIGCHSLSSDGKFTALTFGGSSTCNGANYGLFDIANTKLMAVNAAQVTMCKANNNCMYSNTKGTADDNYWKMFRVETIATETTWAPTVDTTNNPNPTTTTMGNAYVMVNMWNSKLYLTDVRITQAANATAPGTADVVRRTGFAFPTSAPDMYQSDPFWGQNGDFLVFTSFATPDPTQPVSGAPVCSPYNMGLNGDMRRDGRIAIATAVKATNTLHDDAHVIVDRQAGKSLYYPSINSDSTLVVYNQSVCLGSSAASDVDVNKVAGDYGEQSCDGYDDMGATLWTVKPDGSGNVSLDKANGGTMNGNSWPRWSPDSGMFRGKRLYWLAFSSRRAYGMQANPSGTAPRSTTPQLWFAGVGLGGELQGDPSFAPVWLPNQNPLPATPNGNHVPQWTPIVVAIVN
jgi:hypothetical protein